MLTGVKHLMLFPEIFYLFDSDSYPDFTHYFQQYNRPEVSGSCKKVSCFGDWDQPGVLPPVWDHTGCLKVNKLFVAQGHHLRRPELEVEGLTLLIES